MTIPLLNQFIELVMIMFTSSVRMIPIVESRRGKNAQGFNQLNFNFYLTFLFFSLIDVFCFDLRPLQRLLWRDKEYSWNFSRALRKAFY